MRSLSTSFFRSRRMATAAAALMAFSLTAVPALALDPQTAPVEATAPAADPEPFTYEVMLRLNRLSDPQVSPDGHWLTYQVRAVDPVNGGGGTTLWLQDLTSDAEPRPLFAGGGQGNTVRWAPDGQTLYFLSSRSGSNQIWATGPDGAEVMQVTDLPVDVQAYKVSPDGERLAVALAVYPDCDSLACSVARGEAEAARKTTGRVYDRMFVRHWDTWNDGTQNHLFVVELGEDGQAEGEPVWVTRGFDGDTPSKPFGGEEDFTFSPDSQSLVFSAREAGSSEPWSTDFDLWMTDGLTDSGDFTNLTESNPAWDAGPVFSPDGRTLAYRAMARPGFEADKFAIMLRDMDTGQVRQIAANWDRSADSLAFSPDGNTLYVTAQDVGQHRLFAVDTRNGAVIPFTGEGSVGSHVLTPSGIVYAQAALDQPGDLWFKTYRGREMPRRLTEVNPELADLAFGEAEQFTFEGWNDETVHGYVIKPANYVEGRKYPVAFLIHGGPQGSFGNGWSYRWNPQTYAGAGYAVVMIDFHGSTGYGQAFTDSISQHWGDRPLEDLQKGWAAAQQKYDFLDGDRACALGASYGGYMINWISGNWPNAFKCMVNHDGVFDTFAMGFATEELWFTEWENGGTPWENPRAYQEFNPANHVNKWNTPMLVIQGEQDFRIPTSQGLSAFTALQRQGIESRLLVFPDENHWVLKPQNSLQWHNEVFGWLDKYLGE